jgi:hypothetical protein
MAVTDKKKEGPSCACGKVDLYEEWLIQNNESKKDDSSTTTIQSEDQLNSTGTDGKADPTPFPAKE